MQIRECPLQTREKKGTRFPLFPFILQSYSKQGNIRDISEKTNVEYPKQGKPCLQIVAYSNPGQMFAVDPGWRLPLFAIVASRGFDCEVVVFSTMFAIFFKYVARGSHHLQVICQIVENQGK